MGSALPILEVIVGRTWQAQCDWFDTRIRRFFYEGEVYEMPESWEPPEVVKVDSLGKETGYIDKMLEVEVPTIRYVEQTVVPVTKVEETIDDDVGDEVAVAMTAGGVPQQSPTRPGQVVHTPNRRKRGGVAKVDRED